jgi:hypothetical protein
VCANVVAALPRRPAGLVERESWCVNFDEISSRTYTDGLTCLEMRCSTSALRDFCKVSVLGVLGHLTDLDENRLEGSGRRWSVCPRQLVMRESSTPAFSAPTVSQPVFIQLQAPERAAVFL